MTHLQIVYLLKMVIFHIFHGYVRQNPPFPSPKSSWPPMGSMDIHVLQAMTAIRSSCFERLGCLGRPLELWLTPQISQCGNLWKSVEICGMLDLSGSVSPAPIRMLRLDALCMFRDIVVSPTSQGVTMGRARDHLISPKMLCRNFEHHWFMIWHVFTCFYMFLLTFSVIYIRAEVHHLSGPLPFGPALWHFWVYLSGASGKACRLINVGF